MVTDLHLNVKKESRLNYLGEVLDSIDQIDGIRDKYAKEGARVNLILLGDVVDKSIADSEKALLILNILRYITGRFDRTFAVVGNHEITYATANPFWHMVQTVSDPALGSIARMLQPRGLDNCIAVVDKLTRGNVDFYFNHFGTKPKTPQTEDGRVTIGLFHQPVGSNDICKMWGTFDDVEQASYIQQYNYAFFGHMHMAYGSYWLNEEHTCRGIWLGTIGRTTVPEVEDTPSERVVPAVIIEDGVFKEVEDNTITVLPAKECVDYETYTRAKTTREELKERVVVAESESFGETLHEVIEQAALQNDLGGVLLMCKDGEYAAETRYREYCSGVSTEINDLEVS